MSFSADSLRNDDVLPGGVPFDLDGDECPPVSGVRRRVSSIPPSLNDPQSRLESTERDLAMAKSIVTKRRSLEVDSDPSLTQQWERRVSALCVNVGILRRQVEELRGISDRRLMQMRRDRRAEVQEVLFVAGDLE